MKALVLSGGGAHGAYEAGAAKALLEREEYDLICGVSIGAINAALIAAGVDNALERFWHRELPAQARQLFPHVPRLRRLFSHIGSIGNGGGWKDAVSVARAATELPYFRKLGRVHRTSLPAVAASLGAMVDFSRLHTSLLLGATNASRACASVFRASVGRPRPPSRHSHLTEYHDLTEDNFVMALLASSAMPGLFSPIELTFGGQSALYADGCLVHTSPLGIALDNGATELTVVFVDQEPRPDEAGTARGITQIAYNIATLWQQRLLDYELRLAEATNEIVRLGGTSDKRQVSIHYVRPRKPLELDMLAFDDAAALKAAFQSGYEDGTAANRPAVMPFVPSAPAKPAWWKLRSLFPRSAAS